MKLQMMILATALAGCTIQVGDKTRYYRNRLGQALIGLGESDGSSVLNSSSGVSQNVQDVVICYKTKRITVENSEKILFEKLNIPKEQFKEVYSASFPNFQVKCQFYKRK